MTVAELIEQLQNLPPTDLVFTWDGADYCPEMEPATLGPLHTMRARNEEVVPGCWAITGLGNGWMPSERVDRELLDD